MTERQPAESTADVATDLRKGDRILMLVLALLPIVVALAWQVLQGGAG